MNSLVQKDRYRLILRYIGFLIMGVGFFLLLPLITLLFYPDEISELFSFLVPSLLAFGTGLLIVLISGNVKKNIALDLKEGGVIVVISWGMAIFFSAIPFLLGLKLNFTQAFFEATSGWTTTGLSVINIEKVPGIYLMWRSIIQFLGGAGLVVIMLSSILHPHGFGLYFAEGRSDQLLPHVRRSTSMIMYIYSGYVISGIILYYLAGMDLFDAINHSMAALSTGGFSTKAESIGAFNSVKIELVSIVLMILGSLNFATHYTLLKGKFRIFFKNAEVKLLLFLLALFIPLVFFFTSLNLTAHLGYRFRISIFEVVSALTTTGFSIGDFNLWNHFGFLILIILMGIGGGTGSTAGGIKQYRIYLMLKSLFWNIQDFFLPRTAVKQHYIWRGEKKFFIKSEYLKETAIFIFLYFVTYLSGVMIFLGSGYGFRESLFEFASALGTVGLSIGITNSTTPGIILWTEICGMILGRLEFFVIFYSVIKLIKDFRFALRAKKPI